MAGGASTVARTPERFAVPLPDGQATSALHYAPASSSTALFVFAHGAGAGQGHAFMVGYASALAAAGVDVVTFNFPYMEAGRRVPDRTPILESCVRAVIRTARARSALATRPLFIGGKSMGGRMATHVAAEGVEDLRGVITLGYPLHPPGKPDQLRIAHLSSLRVPWLVVQGERDTFGTPAELGPYLPSVPGGATLLRIARGDHSLTVKGQPADMTRGAVVQRMLTWMAEHR